MNAVTSLELAVSGVDVVPSLSKSLVKVMHVVLLQAVMQVDEVQRSLEIRIIRHISQSGSLSIAFRPSCTGSSPIFVVGGIVRSS